MATVAQTDPKSQESLCKNQTAVYSTVKWGRMLAIGLECSSQDVKQDQRAAPFTGRAHCSNSEDSMEQKFCCRTLHMYNQTTELWRMLAVKKKC